MNIVPVEGPWYRVLPWDGRPSIADSPPLYETSVGGFSIDLQDGIADSVLFSAEHIIAVAVNRLTTTRLDSVWGGYVESTKPVVVGFTVDVTLTDRPGIIAPQRDPVVFGVFTVSEDDINDFRRLHTWAFYDSQRAEHDAALTRQQNLAYIAAHRVEKLVLKHRQPAQLEQGST